MEDILYTTSTFFQENLADIIWIVLLLIIGKVFLRRLIKAILHVSKESGERSTSYKQRVDTLASVFATTGNIVIYVIVLLMVLSLFEVDIRPILAGAGVIGLAVGFGSQTLVKDFVAGLFIFLENQYAIGERVKIDKYEGTVKHISIRTTVIQEDNGNIVYCPNNSFKHVVNLSRRPQEKK